MMADNRPVIHIRIRDLRRQRSLTQEELAAALGVSRQSINAMEAGRCLPSLPMALQLASFFSLPLHDIVDDTISNLSAMNTPVPWSPLRDMREALDELMDESVSWGGLPQVNAPAVNVTQTGNSVEVEARLPGYQKEDISIEVGEDFLTIAGEATQEEEKEERQYFRREFVRQNFQRTVSLPALVQADKAAAEMKNGVLKVRLPKIAEEKPKTAKVTIN